MKKDYREKTVRGMIADITVMKPMFKDVTVRMTSDRHGQSLSMACANVIIEIPLEAVRDIIRVAKKEGEE